MEEFYFDFLNEDYSDTEIINRAKLYIRKVDEAYSLLSDKKKKEAFQIFKEINKAIRYEYDKYSKQKHLEIPSKHKIYNQYIWAIKDISSHLTNTNSYASLSSNLYDVSYYLKYYMKDKVR